MLKINKVIKIETEDWIWTRTDDNWRFRNKNSEFNNGFADLDVYIQLLDSIAEHQP